MEKHKILLKFLIENEVDYVDESSASDVETLKELVDSGLVKAIDARSDAGDCYMEPHVTLRGREWLNSNSDDNSTPSEDIVELKPNFMGIGLNLNALYRWFRRSKT